VANGVEVEARAHDIRAVDLRREDGLFVERGAREHLPERPDDAAAAAGQDRIRISGVGLDHW
jgi:hypothetical protein